MELKKPKMKHLLISLATLSLLAVAGCSKTATVDPRDQYTGTYNMTNVSSVKPANGASTVGTSAVVLRVTKASSDNTVLIVDGKDNYPAVLNGNAYTIPSTVISQVIGSSAVAVTVTGSGSFVGATLFLNLSGSTVINGTSYAVTISGNGNRQ